MIVIFWLFAKTAHNAVQSEELKELPVRDVKRMLQNTVGDYSLIKCYAVKKRNYQRKVQFV